MLPFQKEFRHMISNPNDDGNDILCVKIAYFRSFRCIG